MDIPNLQDRIKNLIILLTDGHPYKVGDLTFGSSTSKKLSVTGYTVTNDLKYLTHESALMELDQIKLIFNEILNSSKELADFIESKEIEFHLDHDYGMGTLEICCEKQGNIHWNYKPLN